MTSSRGFLAVAVFATLICGERNYAQTAFGCCINCYYCNSANNSACLDVNRYDDEVRALVVPVVNCETASPVQYNFFCRKITQTIFHEDRQAEVRVTRGCGWVRDDRRECYRANNRDHLETVCQCFTDHCNSADSADPASSVTLFLVFAAVLYFYR